MAAEKQTNEVQAEGDLLLTMQEKLNQSSRDTLEEIRSSMQPDVLSCWDGMPYGNQRKYLVWEASERMYPEQLEIIQVTDVQFGHVMCNYKRVIEYRDWVLSVPNRFMLWTGDMIDAWAAWSPGRPYEQLFDPLSQVIRFAEVWAPARHRVLGFVGGNHERRAIPGFGDLGTLLAMMLKLPYSGGRQMIDIYYGKHQPFKISLWHGRGAARTKGSIMQNLDRFMRQGDSQLYLTGHLHQPMISVLWKEVRDPEHRTIKLQKSYGGVGASFLSTWGTYGELAGYDPCDVLMPRVVLESNGHYELTLK